MTGKIAMIFPGQGAQFVGMGKDFYEQFSVAKEIFDEANDRLSFYLTKLMFEGDPKELALTKNSQVAIYVMSLAVLRVIQSEFQEMRPAITAGLSLGEYSALTAAGMISFQDCLDLVYQRGLYMNQAAEDHPGTMAAALGITPEEVEKALEGLPVWIANLNCKGQVVISGEKEGFEKAMQLVKEAGAKRVIPLDVSGAFHTRLMNDAKEKLTPRIMDTSFEESAVDIYMNVTGEKTKDIAAVKQNLASQVVAPVLWEKSVYAMASRDPKVFIEIGPGNTLAGMNRKNQVKQSTISIGTVDHLEQLEKYCNQTVR